MSPFLLTGLNDKMQWTSAKIVILLAMGSLQLSCIFQWWTHMRDCNSIVVVFHDARTGKCTLTVESWEDDQTVIVLQKQAGSCCCRPHLKNDSQRKEEHGQTGMVLQQCPQCCKTEEWSDLKFCEIPLWPLAQHCISSDQAMWHLLKCRGSEKFKSSVPSQCHVSFESCQGGHINLLWGAIHKHRMGQPNIIRCNFFSFCTGFRKLSKPSWTVLKGEPPEKCT